MARNSTSINVFNDFASLALSSNLKVGSKAYRKAQGEFIVTEFDEYFGEPTKLLNWQKLCSDLGISGPTMSITQCRKALKKVWVNIWDFLSAIRSGEKPKLWRSEKELAEYTLRTKKVYPKEQAKQAGPVSALLARIY